MEFLFPESDPNPKLHTVTMSSIYQVLMQTGLYGYVLFVAANMIGDNAELLLLVPEMATLVGSVVLPILGAVPDGLMVLFSGLGDDAANQVSVGMGALAGSTVMLLTLPWFLSILVGRVSIIKDGNGESKLNYKPGKGEPKLRPEDKFIPWRAGVAILPDLRRNAKIMLATCFSYAVIQLPALKFDDQSKSPSKKEYNKESGEENPFAAFGMVSCIIFFVGYIYLMFKDSKGDDNKIVAKTVEAISDGTLTLRAAMMQFTELSWDKLRKPDGNNMEQGLIRCPPEAEAEVRRMCKVLAPFFSVYDTDNSGTIDLNEFMMLINDLQENVPKEKAEQIFKAADRDKSQEISFDEFTACMVAMALDPKPHYRVTENTGSQGRAIIKRASMFIPATSEQQDEGDGDDGDVEDDMPEDLADLPPEEQQKRIKKRAFMGLTLGTVLVVLFSDPMVDMLGLIGDILQIDKFIIAFLIGPLASNASELLSSMKLAAKCTPKSMVSSVSTLLGAAIMNNSFVLSIFFFLIVFKHLAWKFTAETASILLIQIVIGILTLVKSTHTLLDGCIILLCYPGALLIFTLLEDMNLD